MDRRYRILLVCNNATESEEIATALHNKDTEVQTATGLKEALAWLGQFSYEMLLIDSRAGGGNSALAFLTQARKRLPKMLRVILETAPLQVDAVELVNQVAPTAIFRNTIDTEAVREMLKEHFGPAHGEAPALDAYGNSPDGNEKRGMSEVERMEFITDLSVQVNGMMEDPNLELPVLSDIANRVRDLLADERADFEAVAELVEMEQGMSSRILQIANSPIYAGLERIQNLQGAVARLGMRETRNILQLVIVQNLFRTSNRSLAKLMKVLWLHSLCVAYGNELIAQRLEIKESKDYFMMGLLHDVGKLLIIHLVEVGRREDRWGGREVDDQIMAKLLAMRHNDMGARLLEKWHYPAQMQEVTRLHDDASNLRLRPEYVVVTFFSNLLSRKVGFSLIPYEEGALDNRELASALNMDDATRDEIEQSLRALTEKIRQSCLAD